MRPHGFVFRDCSWLVPFVFCYHAPILPWVEGPPPSHNNSTASPSPTGVSECVKGVCTPFPSSVGFSPAYIQPFAPPSKGGVWCSHVAPVRCLGVLQLNNNNNHQFHSFLLIIC